MIASKHRHQFWFWTIVLGGAALIYAGLMAIATLAHADPVVAAPTATPPDGPGPITWGIVLALAIAVGNALSALLHVIAPRTRNTYDDTARDLLDRLLGMARAAPPPKPRDPQSGRVSANALILLATAGLCVAMVAVPACSASQREGTIKAALVTADVTREAFVAFDTSRQSEIAEAATSLEDGKAKLAAYRGKREKAEKAFAVAYRAIAVAATLNDDQSITALQTAVADVVAAVNELTGGKP